MEYHGRAMQCLPNELVVLIAECMDHETRTSFMMANKGIYALLKLYEHSISKNCTAKVTLPPSGDILSSFSGVRRVLGSNTFPMIAELESRESWINDFLKDHCPEIVEKFLRWLYGREAEMVFSSVEQHFKRALYHCDRIADIAANESPIPRDKYRLIKTGVYTMPSSFLSAGLQTKLNPLYNPLARPKQIQYILSLPLPDVVAIFSLIHSVSLFVLGSLPLPPELGTIYEECFLRHGTWFMRALFSPNRDMCELISYIASAGRFELHLWESGDIQGPDGLKMTLMRRLKELFGGAEGPKLHRKFTKALIGLGFSIHIPENQDMDDDDEEEEEEEEEEEDESDDDASVSGVNPNQA
ncbi:hypothetical protein F5Y03DRAFT_396455 [Xylaria venustula]|nr:hypothetical protein F5Y03DRAFT_396455 [Xylaria venustula]